MLSIVDSLFYILKKVKQNIKDSYVLAEEGRLNNSQLFSIKIE
jgi:hypothetical protein